MIAETHRPSFTGTTAYVANRARLERRMLRLMRLERLARMTGASATLDDIFAIAEELGSAIREWREAVGR